MFSSTSNFRYIQCPLEEECAAPNCIFKHSGYSFDQAGKSTPEQNQSANEPPKKRQKLEIDEYHLESANDTLKSSLSSQSLLPDQSVQPAQAKQAKAFVGALLSKKVKDPAASDPNGNGRIHSSASPSLTEPPARDIAGQNKDRAKGRPESLNPRMLKSPPARHATRVLYLEKMHEALVALDNKLRTAGTAAQKKGLMSRDELITLALDEEERIATESPAVYANVIKMRLVAYKKMGLAEWSAARTDSTASLAAQQNEKRKGPANEKTSRGASGLSAPQEVCIVSRLLANQNGLEKFGYVTSIPKLEDVANVSKAVELSDYWEKCDRCDSRFQVFPDRRQDGALTSGGECRHHLRRAIPPPRDAFSRGSSSKIYPCCNESIGTSGGCEVAESHVFKITDGNRLASVTQFEETPENPEAPANRAVSFDCEMGYTTQGLEVIRLTALSWPEANLLLDVLVKPLGTVLDFNTRFSGITAEQFANAAAYTPDPTSKPDESGEVKVVESIHIARELFFRLVSPHTPLIGHGIENDLNAMRIVHPCIIDTIILFPLRNGLPYRRSLKAAAKEFLGQSIQNGGAAGHDSKEDARATGDLVRFKVEQTWNAMRRNGWTFHGDELRPPPNASLEDSASTTDKRIEEHQQRKFAAAGGLTSSPGR